MYTLYVRNHPQGTATHDCQYQGTLEELIAEIEHAQGQEPTLRYVYSSEVDGGHIWYDEQIAYEWDQAATDLNGDALLPDWGAETPDEGEEPDFYLHRRPRPVTAELVAKFAAEALDVHPQHVSIRDDNGADPQAPHEQ